jgi:hypothetical protein
LDCHSVAPGLARAKPSGQSSDRIAARVFLPTGTVRPVQRETSDQVSHCFNAPWLAPFLARDARVWRRAKPGRRHYGQIKDRDHALKTRWGLYPVAFHR